MLIAGSVTFYTVVIGNFFVPAAADLEVDYSSISLYTTVVYLGIACGLPFVGNDEGMVAFSRTAGPDKPDYLHLLFAFR